MVLLWICKCITCGIERFAVNPLQAQKVLICQRRLCICIAKFTHETKNTKNFLVEFIWGFMNKKLLLFFTIFICILSVLAVLQPSKALAVDGSYVRVEKDNVWLYRNPVNSDIEKLFILEKSYYLKAIEAGTLYYTVEIFDNADGFNKIVGYVKRSDVTVCQTTPILPLYPKYTLNVITTSSNLKQIANSSGATVATMLKNQSVKYYGMYTTENNIWYYVRFGLDMGYISSSDVTAPNFALHPTPLPVEIIPPDPNPEPPEKNDNLLQAVLVGLVCIPAVVIIFTLFSSDKTKGGFFTKPQTTNQKQTLKPRFVDDREDFNDYDLL